MPWRTVAAFAALVVLVGTNIVAVRLTGREIPPFWNAGARFALAAIVFALAAALRRPARPSLGAVRGSVWYGLLAFAAFFAFVYVGLVEATAALGQTVLALGPLLTLIMAAAVGSETITARALFGSGVALLGIALVFGAQEHLDVPVGSLAALLAGATAFAAGTVVARRIPPMDPFLSNAIATGVGAGALLPLSVIAGERWVIPAGPATWIGFIYLVLPGTVVLFLLFLYLLRRLPASVVSYQFVLAPVVSITLAALLLDEAVGPGTVAGALLVICGVYIGALSHPSGRAPGMAEAR